MVDADGKVIGIIAAYNWDQLAAFAARNVTANGF
jgi:hypothetical protein